METKIAAATGFAPATSVRRQHAKLGNDLHAEVAAALEQATNEGITDPEMIQARIATARGMVMHVHKEAEAAEAAARLAHEDELRAKARAMAGPNATLPQVTEIFMRLVSEEFGD